MLPVHIVRAEQACPVPLRKTVASAGDDDSAEEIKREDVYLAVADLRMVVS